MKHFSKFFLLLLAPAAALAQPTITQADFPVPGTYWQTIGDSTLVLPFTAAGPGQTWNYAAQLANPTDSSAVTFVSPSVTPPAFQQAYPNANLAVYEPLDSISGFYLKNATGLYLDGFYIGTTSNPGFNTLDYAPDQLLVPAPFTYNNTRSHTSKVTVTLTQMGSTFKLVQYIFQDFVADAYGSLTTPAGTFPNTLRLRSTAYLQDTVYADLGGILVPIQSSGPHDTTAAYQWLQNGSESLLLQAQEDMASPGNSLPGSIYYYDYTQSPLAAPHVAATPQVQPYPNPASSLIRIPVEAPAAENLIIYEVSGRQVASENVRGIQLLSYGTQHLAAGLYTYRIQDKAGNQVQVGRFTVLR